MIKDNQMNHSCYTDSYKETNNLFTVIINALKAYYKSFFFFFFEKSLNEFIVTKKRSYRYKYKKKKSITMWKQFLCNTFHPLRFH